MSIISLISGNDTPVGEQWVDDRVEEGQELLSSAVNQVKAWSADDPDTWTDDALRWVGGAIKATGNWWQDATADQEGIGDDILRGLGWTGKKALQVADAGSYYGGMAGGKIAEMIGFDARIGGFAGNVIGDVALGGAFAKVGQSAKTYNRIKKLRRLGADDLQIQHLFTRQHAFAYGELADAPSDIRLALTTKKPKAGKKLLQNLTKVDENGNYLKPVERIATGSGTRTGMREGTWSKAKMASQFVEDKRGFNTAKFRQMSGAAPWEQNKKWSQTGGTTTPWAHHHIVDHDIAGPAFNRVDAPEIDRILKEKGIRLGDDEANVIAAGHYKATNKPWQDAILEQKPDTPQRALDDLTKAAEIDDFGELIPPDISGRYTYGAGPEQYPGQLYVQRWRTWGIDRVAMKVNPQTMIMGKDHTGIIHEAYKRLPSNQLLRDAFKSGEYWTWPPEKAANAIAAAAIDQKNISLNVAKWRLNLIKQKLGMGKADGLKFIPNTKGEQIPTSMIIKWIKKYPADAANLGWMEKPPTLLELTRSHGKVDKQLATIFTYKQ